MEQILKFILDYGLGYALFIWLLIDSRKDSKTREQKYQETIHMLGSEIIERLEGLENVDK